MTLKEAAQSALDCQNACNLSGVVFSFAEVMQAICDEQNRLGEGTDWKNEHPIVTLFLDKLVYLNGGSLIGDYSRAYAYVRSIAEESDL